MCFFSDVDVLDVNSNNWNIRYNRNNQTYRMLISICYLTINGLLQTQTDGTIKLMNYLDEQRMYRLYEKFILEYYRKEYPMITVNASQICKVFVENINWIKKLETRFASRTYSFFLYAYRNQTNFIRRRVEIVNDQEKNNEMI